jgi:hypothetical protein
MFACAGRYRETDGTISVGEGAVTFSRIDGRITKTERITISIPVRGIRSVNLEEASRSMLKRIAIQGSSTTKVVILVDSMIVPGIPRHEFQTGDARGLYNAIQEARAFAGKDSAQQSQGERTIIKETIREIVKVPCPYCGTLVENTQSKCSTCGGPIR